jgi:hypothetical protein
MAKTWTPLRKPRSRRRSGSTSSRSAPSWRSTATWPRRPHPIYTGLIVMAIGTAINYGRAVGFALLVALCGGLWWRAQQEERIMSTHFPDAYAEYRMRVRAIIPFVL